MELNPNVDVLWIGIGNLLYTLGFITAIFYLLRARHHPRWLLYMLIAGGYAIQTYGLYLRGMEVQGCPTGNTFEIVQFVIWSLTFCFLVLGPAFRLSLFGFFTAGLAVMLSILSYAIPAWDTPYPINASGANPSVEFHASLAVFSYGIFGLLAVSSILYLLQNYSLKHHRWKGVFAFLPSLVESETMTLRMLAAGSGVLTVSLLVGSVYWIQNSAEVDSAKLVATVAVWLAYLVVLGLRLINRLYAKRLAVTCIVLFFVAILSIWPIDASRHSKAPSNAATQLSPSE
ncbi:MAG: cytochrome c biogenesis protein CcsA [Verrucomicrobia bacterium]|nr:cytochrome c biogenesis protein CcsA [Verrucomicrobiota bacterium]